MAENRTTLAELDFQLVFEEVEKFVLLLPKGERGIERKAVVAQVLVKPGEDVQEGVVRIGQLEIGALLYPRKKRLMVVRRKGLLEGLLIAGVVMLKEDNGDLHQPFDADGELVEDLEQVRAVVQLPQFVETAQSVVDESAGDVQFLAQPEVLPEFGPIHLH